MTRVALYARFSTDLQRQTSIADQLRAARARAAAEGWQIVAEHADEGVSGSVPVTLRAGGKALLADALASRFDILIVEGLDRLSRDVGEQDQVVKRLEYRGLRLIGTSDGYDTQAKGRKVMRVARGLVNELYLDDLREKTHRGLAGQFSRGFSAGGRSFGYRSEPDGERGRRLVIEPAEAAIVRDIFERAAAGRSARAIVFDLNARGVPAPRGGTWAVSCIGGSRERGLGLLQNELYRGRVVWNRRQWLKDPETGRRRYVQRPEAEWLTREQPELRIVSDELWEAARRARRADRNHGGNARATLFGGLLRCGACGGAVVAINAKHYGCAARKDRGPAVCPSVATWRRDRVDLRLVAEVRDGLLEPDAIAELRRAVRAQVAAGGEVDEGRRRRQTALRGEIGRLVDAVAMLGGSDALAARLKASEQELATLDAEERNAAAAAAAGADLAERAIADYRALLLRLHEALEGEEDRAETRRMLADLLGRVTLVREGDEDFAELEEPAERLLLAVGGVDGRGCEGAQHGRSTVRRLRI